MHKRNKLNDVTKGSARKSNADPAYNNNGSGSGNTTNSNNKKTNVAMNMQMNNGAMKNDVYESVCSPEDVAERTKVAQRHAMKNCNGNSGSLGSNGSITSGGSSRSSSTNSSSALNNSRLNKRTIPTSPSNETRSKCIVSHVYIAHMLVVVIYRSICNNYNE